MRRLVCASVLACIVTVLTSCGGGGDLSAPPAMQSMAERRVTPLAAPGNANVDSTIDVLFAFAEQQFPSIFPPGQANRKLNGWTYRHYPSTGVYLAVIDWRVYVMGGTFGPEIRDMGEVTAYVAAVNVANRAPVVALQVPAGDFKAPASIVLSATASDPDNNLARVEFYVNGFKIGEASSAPFAVDWRNVGAGDYLVEAVAVDLTGATATTPRASVAVRSNLWPVVLLTAPSSGSTTVAGTTVNLAADAADDGSVAKVEFFAGPTKIGEDLAAPYALAWIATAGTHSLTARVTDNLGVTTTSNAVALTVTAIVPPSPMAPLFGNVTFQYRVGTTSFTDTVRFTAANQVDDGLVAPQTNLPTLTMACLRSDPPLQGYSFFCQSKYSSGAKNSYLFNVANGVIAGKYTFCLSSQSSSSCNDELLFDPDSTLTGTVTPIGAMLAAAAHAANPDADVLLKEQIKNLAGKAAYFGAPGPQNAQAFEVLLGLRSRLDSIEASRTSPSNH